MDIYYAVWAQMSNWTINQRAILVLGVGCLIFVVFLKLIGFRLAALFFMDSELASESSFYLSVNSVFYPGLRGGRKEMESY